MLNREQNHLDYYIGQKNYWIIFFILSGVVRINKVNEGKARNYIYDTFEIEKEFDSDAFAWNFAIRM